ncbi:acetyl-CoA C-acyltransferase [Granulicatella sp. zg-ZJ]|uniref:acetyl-CoA C-acetyltransferase n=1 Tax=Granulicatella sp. zg-ZJ TaxID=2678504 RepID=UPI0013D53687|nr:acetyl-CoA C-acetyltransferase [Granulicatella sp. zg-ZJ]NEW62580.1 acetyl-CoA C-acyltransferase [Granulicatella sp. zg-ZJ]
MKDIVIVGALRTPIGKFLGGLRQYSAVELGTIVSTTLLEKTKINKDSVDYAIFGNVLQANNGQNPARQIALKSGLNQQTPAVTVNEVCGSGLKAIMLAYQSLALGDANMILAGGTESMSNAPHYAINERTGAKYGHQSLFDSILVDGLTDAFSQQHMGITAENIAKKYHITREEQDNFAFYSHQKAIQHIQHESLCAIDELTQDESIRLNISLNSLGKLPPVFDKNGSVTAGNASPLNDGAAALLLTTRDYAQQHNLPILASILGYSEIGNDPDYMGMAPVNAVHTLCQKTSLTLEDFDCIELNEAFAAQSLAVIHELGLNQEKVNMSGGAIALGHPIGASGARIVVSLLHQLKETKGTYGLATLCVGGGIGIALAIKSEQ